MLGPSLWSQLRALAPNDRVTNARPRALRVSRIHGVGAPKFTRFHRDGAEFH
jgi:hypothetical protein